MKLEKDIEEEKNGWRIEPEACKRKMERFSDLIQRRPRAGRDQAKVEIPSQIFLGGLSEQRKKLPFIPSYKKKINKI